VLHRAVVLARRESHVVGADVVLEIDEALRAAGARTRHLPQRQQRRPLGLLRDEKLLAAFAERGIVRPLSDFYLDRGFVEHELGLGSVHLDLAEGGVSIHVKIIEGKRFRVGRLGGGLTPGQVFSQTRLARAMARLARAPIRSTKRARPVAMASRVR